MAGRPVSGGDPAKRQAMRKWYRSKSPAERRAWASKRDPQKQRNADNRRYKRDALKRIALHKRVNRVADPQKIKARKASNSQARGVEKARSCRNCGSRTGVQLHHPDYSKPLHTVPLCTRCHGRATRPIGVRND